jgi:hypothetical protein
MQAARDSETVTVGNAPSNMHVASRDHIYMLVGIAWNASSSAFFQLAGFHELSIVR